MTAPALPLPARARAGRLRMLAAGVAIAAALGLALALTGSATHAPQRAAAPPANPDGLIHGATLQQARCTTWLAASAGDRAFAVRSLAAVVGSPTEYKGVRGTTLSQAQTYQLLDNACSNPIAKNFLLYELYIRAAAFRSLLPAQQP
ncbi:MAG: hypothetical protein QOC55_2052 [Thermoleophilaceae bacterium]|nr:hypothetical protein [Thermoleophilaceae bacterium]